MTVTGTDVLVVNAGSTGVKLDVVDAGGRSRTLRALADAPGGLAGVGHRVVHGGGRFTAPVRIDDDVLAALDEVGALAPLHNGPAVRLAREARAALPDVPHVAVFDTAFHATMPDEATRYAVPDAWVTGASVRRYGFHGLSVEWACERAAAVLGGLPSRTVVCHLGGGASVTAVRDGRSVDTSMGMSPLDGLVMATRAGAIDPDVPLHMILRRGVPAAEVEDVLNHASGMTALAGTADMREVEAAGAAGDARARGALDVHDHRLAAVVAGMTAALGGLDLVVFTGGAGEGSSRTRAALAGRLAHLGVAIDPGRNAHGGEGEVSAAGAAVRTLVVHAREDVVIARAVRRVTGHDGGERA
ncbi:acetate/propionate family kinase [Miltoncostaea oceani]|uniref:acetate/propionate family kinase n=1 Tax=Miltoncostaea oceani TaxID=2843216 RepID=UPI001C3D600B|nr:acetate/propionate family kinase [Miltoncostaea oceani]